jgi:hypothetical protein
MSFKSDLAVIMGSLIVYYSCCLTVREAYGPFQNELLVTSLLTVYQVYQVHNLLRAIIT